jgi:hypothetical protein
MNMIGHDLQFENFRRRFATDLLDNLLEAHVRPVFEDIPAVLRAPNDLVFTGVNHVIAGLVANAIFKHADIIQNPYR